MQAASSMRTSILILCQRRNLLQEPVGPRFSLQASGNPDFWPQKLELTCTSITQSRLSKRKIVFDEERLNCGSWRTLWHSHGKSRRRRQEIGGSSISCRAEIFIVRLHERHFAAELQSNITILGNLCDKLHSSAALNTHGDYENTFDCPSSCMCK